MSLTSNQTMATSVQIGAAFKILKRINIKKCQATKTNQLGVVLNYQVVSFCDFLTARRVQATTFPELRCLIWTGTATLPISCTELQSSFFHCTSEGRGYWETPAYLSYSYTLPFPFPELLYSKEHLIRQPEANLAVCTCLDWEKNRKERDFAGVLGVEEKKGLVNAIVCSNAITELISLLPQFATVLSYRIVPFSFSYFEKKHAGLCSDIFPFVIFAIFGPLCYRILFVFWYSNKFMFI